MTFALLSTRSFAVLSDFAQECAAQAAVRAALEAGDAAPDDLMVFVYDDAGSVVREVEDIPLD